MLPILIYLPYINFAFPLFPQKILSIPGRALFYRVGSLLEVKVEKAYVSNHPKPKLNSLNNYMPSGESANQPLK
jgi:hypothetical protein